MRYLILALINSSMWAVASPSETAVKIYSSVCGGDKKIETSGVAVTFRGKSHILTSSWGVLEEAEGNCHEVFSKSLNKTLPAKLIYLDWGSGIALLETSEIHDPMFDFDAGTVPSALNSERKIVGYLKGSESETPFLSRVISLKSTRHHLPSLKTVNEITAPGFDSGFVGAPLFNNGLQAIVSSQYIEIVPGAKARIHEWRNSSNAPANQIVAIPVSLIQERLKNISQDRTTLQPASSKLSDRSEIITQGILWRIKCPELAGKPPKDGIGPIGGADGVGIGGSMKGTETCHFEIEAQKQVPLSHAPFLSGEVEKDLLTFTTNGGPFTVPFLYGRNIANDIIRVPFLTVPHFFTEISLTGRLPVLVLPEPPPIGSSDPIGMMRRENLAYKKLLTDTYSLISKDEDDRADYRQMYARTLLLDSVYWKKVTWFDINKHSLNNESFAKNITYEGQPLRLALLKQYKILEKAFRDAGGN